MPDFGHPSCAQLVAAPAKRPSPGPVTPSPDSRLSRAPKPWSRKPVAAGRLPLMRNPCFLRSRRWSVFGAGSRFHGASAPRTAPVCESVTPSPALIREPRTPAYRSKASLERIIRHYQACCQEEYFDDRYLLPMIEPRIRAGGVPNE